MAFVGVFLQLLLLLALPVTALGLLMHLLYRAFCFLIGVESGRRLLLLCHVPFTPLRELAHLLAALLFGHRVTGCRLLRLNAPDGELSFVEHRYSRKNPVATLGNFFFALWPALGVVLTVLAMLRLLLPETYAAIAAHTAAFGTGMSLSNVWETILVLFDGVFGDFSHRLAAKLLFLAIAALLCLGAYVALEELLQGLSGAVVFTVLTAGLTLFGGLLDPRLGRVLLQNVCLFGVLCLSVHLLLLALAVGMLAFGMVFGLIRLIFGLDRRYWRRYYEAQDASSAVEQGVPETPEAWESYAPPGDEDAPPE